MAELSSSEIERLNDNYQHFFAAKKHHVVYCQRCSSGGETVGTFARHLKTVHYINCDTACPFCYGSVRWRRGDIGTLPFVSQHRQTCLRNFLNGGEMHVPQIDVTTPEKMPLPPEEKRPEFCETCYTHHRRGVRQSMDGRTRHPEFGDSFYAPFPDDPLFSQVKCSQHVLFSPQSGLGAYAYNIFQLFFSGEYVFFHLMVRARVWKKFDQMSWSGVHFLNFGTLCDGTHVAGPEDEDRIHHRHLMVAMKPEDVFEFKNQWKSVVAGEPRSGQKNKLCIAINDCSHLMYCLSYVSRRKGTCDGYGNKNGGKGSHYWIFNELSPCAKLAMASLWPDGHATLISKRYRDRDLSSFYTHIKNVQNEWRVELRYLDLNECNCVIPFAKEYELCDEEEEDRPVVYMYGNKRFLRYVPELQSFKYHDWLRHQRQTGNVFWKCVFDSYYVLGHQQTRSMNVITKVVNSLNATYQQEKIKMTSHMKEFERKVMEHAETSEYWKNIGLRQSESIVQLEAELKQCKKELREMHTENRKRLRRTEEMLE